jgi:hypothetical protein
MFQKVSNTEGIIKLLAKSHKKKSFWDSRLLAGFSTWDPPALPASSKQFQQQQHLAQAKHV